MISRKPTNVVIVLCFFAIGLLAWSNVHGASRQGRCTGCNVVILSVDTLRADELPCMGYLRNTMPNLCAFAHKNILFTNAHSQSTWTLPSEVSFFTALYPSVHRMDNPATDVLGPTIPNLARLYKKAGYKTIFVGNTKEFNVPVEDGMQSDFDRIYDTANMSLTDEVGVWQKTLEETKKSTTPSFVYIYTSYIHDYLIKNYGNVTQFLFDPAFVVPTLPRFDQFSVATIQDTKRALRYYLEKNVHPDMTNRYQEILSIFDRNPTLAAAKAIFDTLPAFDKRVIYFEQVAEILDPTNQALMRYVRNLYDNRLKDLDDAIGPLLNNFETTLGKNSILVIFSDHGENFGDHKEFGHGGVPFDSVTHVPLILSVPTIVQKQIDTLVQLIDAYPTLVTLTGITHPPTTGNHIWPLQGVPGKNPFVISELASGETQSIRTPQWRLNVSHIEPGHTRYELYDELSDPKEEIHVEDAHPDVITQLEHLLMSNVTYTPVVQ